ncbi:MAG TPA: hypothetical protein VHP33_34205 [Polyangiaceae bacterium]|nr:hypothetical protein [Polyangiaceae bacterium]
MAWALLAACSLVVDPESLQKGCPAGSKPCEVTPGELRCVSTSDPEYGCARESCVPCTLFQAVEVCGGDGECAVGTCEPEFENCDSAPKNGCEVDLDSTYDHCGACGASCDDDLRKMPRAISAKCSGGRCVVDECRDGYAECDGAASTGCETQLDPSDCGRCGGCPGDTVCNPEHNRCE